MGLIVLPLQYILVNICMHDQAKKWGGGGGGTSTLFRHSVTVIVTIGSHMECLSTL